MANHIVFQVTIYHFWHNGLMSCYAGIYCVLRMCIDNNHALLSPDVDEFFQRIFPNVLENHLQFTEHLHNYNPFMKPTEGRLVDIPPS